MSQPVEIHPYLVRKQVKAFGIRQYRNCLVIPLRDTLGVIHSLQFIDAEGNKRFLAGGAIAGNYHAIGKYQGTLCIAEGYATAATIYEATEHATAAAFNANNLKAVALSLRCKFPKAKIILCADNDRFTFGNPGVVKAREAAIAVGGYLTVPCFDDLGPYDYYRGGRPMADRTDLNDLTNKQAVRDGVEGAEQVKESDAETITRLAALSLLEYSRVRKGEAERLGARVTDFDAEVKRAREGAKVDLGAALPAGKGQGLNVVEAAPWPDPIDLNEVLNELVTEINRYAVLSVHADTAIALWIAHTYVYDAGDISPFLFLTSPEKRCGKSTVLILLLGLVKRPMVASNISPSSIFRVIEACRPTLLIDEADTFFNENEELRGVMNSGHTKLLAYVIRTVDIGGGVFEPRQFST